MLSHATHATIDTATKNSAIPRNPASRLSQRPLILFLILTGFALRLYHLGSESLWYDETVSAYLATQPITELIAHTARDIHPPAYYLLLYAWRLVSNPSVAFGLEYLYAWPSVCLSILVMALIYTITRRYFGPNAATWALVISLVQPFQVWFAQEVRMYALGACCLMLTLWAVSPLLIPPTKHQPEHQLHSLLSPSRVTLYVTAALLGLYTLYYFLFWLVVLNLGIIISLGRNWRGVRTWLLLQALILVGWLPWLPTFLRQAITPPVPSWRVPWENTTEITTALSEGIAAILIGHTPPLTINWPWALVILCLSLAFYIYTKSITPQRRLIWLLFCFGPLMLLLGVSLIGPNIYHVRYLATYAPIFALLVGAIFAHLRRSQALLPFILLVAISSASLHEFWNNPRYAADDHRSAVATLANQWRPGDAILVNAGWVYTALDLYWPNELPSPSASRPPAIAGMPRLPALIQSSDSLATSAPIIYRTGSVDGPSSLGWGLPESDFYAISQSATTEALAELTANHATIWHYRLYDTVSDPNALIRNWFKEHTTLEYSQPFPGPGFLLLEGYRTSAQIPPTPTADIEISYLDAALHLKTVSYPDTLPAGETLYVNLAWEKIAAVAPAQSPSLSLRLYDAQGQFLLQSDTPVTAANMDSSQSLALPIPADTIPGAYTLSLVVYAPENLEPYAPTAVDNTQLPTPTSLGQVTIGLPTMIPHTQSPQATFDYIDLLKVESPTAALPPNASFATAWTWRPRASGYTDNYTAHLQLIDEATQAVATWDFALGSESYPSSAWAAGYPLTQRVENMLPANIPPGIYQLHISLTRTSDGKAIPARQSWMPWQQPSIKVGQIEIMRETK